MLTVEFLNDRTGTEEIGHYLVRVSLNQRTLFTTRIEGYPRRSGWKELVCLFAKGLVTDEGQQTQSGGDQGQAMKQGPRVSPEASQTAQEDAGVAPRRETHGR